MAADRVPVCHGPAPWKRSLIWLAFLGPFFFLSYGLANWAAEQRAVTQVLFFDWEPRIPFLPWTILPYWSIDLLYGLSFLLCRDRFEVDRHALRLLSVQLISVAFFLLLPLRFGFGRPATSGLFGALFDALAGFDKPYNQAPSLHIGLLVIIWARFAGASRGLWRAAVHGWAVLIAVSALTTYQHHFIDIPTGALVGLFGLWLWPDAGPCALTPLALTDSAVRRRVAGGYLVAALLLTGLATALGGVFLWLDWGSAALALVALIYAVPGAAGFQKQHGRHSLAAGLLLAPYVLGAWLSSRWWTRRDPRSVVVSEGVWLGRLPTARDMAAGNFSALCDLTAELPAPRGGWRYFGQPMLDLVPPTPAQLGTAAAQIESLSRGGSLLVCCALGYSRSACAVAAWLLSSGRAQDVDEAIARVRAHRPQVVLGAAHRDALAAVQRMRGHADAA